MKLKKLVKGICAVLVLSVLAIAVPAYISAYAGSTPASVTVTNIDYSTSMITVKMNADDTALLISDSKQKKWEYSPCTKDSDNCVQLDISWINPANDYTLSLKGDKSSTPVKMIIPKQNKTFKVTFSPINGGKLTFQNADGKIQWKKKDALNWENFPTDASGKINPDAFTDRLQSMCANGAVLLFRVAPENGTSLTAVGKRASKEISVNIAKKIAAPAIKVNDQKMTVAVTKDMEYRYCDKYGNPEGDGIWTSCGKTYDCPLSDIASKAMVAGGSPKDVYIQFRTKATASKQMSNVATVCIPAQTDLAETAKAKIRLVYTSTTSFKIEIAAASAEEPYEYCIINQDDLRDGVTINSIDDIKWKSVNSTSPVSISEKKDKVENGSMVYVRRKAQKSLGDEDYALASPYMFLGTVAYPKDITTLQSGLTWLQTVAGRCNPDNSEGRLDFTFYSETNSPIDEIKFVDFSSTGTVRATLDSADFTSTVSENDEYDSSVTDSGNAKHYKYIINTSITSTKKLDSFAADSNQREMLAYIRIKDSSEEFKSDSTKGIALYIHPATVINNPASESDKNEIASKLGWTGYSASDDHIAYTTEFKRVYGSTHIYNVNNGYISYKNEAACDPTSFRVRLDTGTRYVPAAGTAGSLSGSKVEVEKIKYDGVEFAKNAKDSSGKNYFTVEYADIKSATDEQRMAVLTVNVDAIEKNTQIDDRDKDTPLYIFLSNGEVIKDKVKINLQNTAMIVDYDNKTKGSQSLTINEMLETEIKKTVDGKEQIEKAPNTYHICLEKFNESYDVSLDKVTWNGQLICTNISSASKYITMEISNSMMNEIFKTVTPGTSQSAYLVFEFDNGFTITSGWKITFNRPAGT